MGYFFEEITRGGHKKSPSPPPKIHFIYWFCKFCFYRGLDICVLMVRIQDMRFLAFKLVPWDFFEQSAILLKIYENYFIEKSVRKLCRTATIKQRHIKCSSFFFHWTTTDKLEFTDWAKVNQMFGCGEITIFRQRMKISKMCLQTSSDHHD